MTKVLLYLLKIFLFFGALLGINFEEMCGSPAPTPSPSPAETAPAEMADLSDTASDRAPTGCPVGLCVIGRTSTIPPRPICGECRTATQHPRPTSCPKLLAPGSTVYLNDKPYGHGFDSTVRVKGDQEFCYLIHGVWVNDCHLEGWPKRVQCEMELIQGCPIWQYTVNGTTAHGCFDDRWTSPVSCDHFGSVGHQDDPQTPTTGDTLATLRGFEGLPLECGLQRNAYGPMAGFFTVAHGIGYVRACKPNGAGCGPWQPFDH